MKYIVIELQNTNGSVAHLFDAYDDRNQAESKYHLVLSAAAVSQIPVHTAVLMTDEGFTLESKCYEHEVQPVTAETPPAEEPEE